MFIVLYVQGIARHLYFIVLVIATFASSSYVGYCHLPTVFHIMMLLFNNVTYFFSVFERSPSRVGISVPRVPKRRSGTTFLVPRC